MSVEKITIEEAKSRMIEHSREIVWPSFAAEITEAFGFSLKDLGLKTKKLSEFPILFDPANKDAECIAIEDVARTLAEKISGQQVYSNQMGRGSSAQEITEKSVALI